MEKQERYDKEAAILEKVIDFIRKWHIPISICSLVALIFRSFSDVPFIIIGISEVIYQVVKCLRIISNNNYSKNTGKERPDGSVSARDRYLNEMNKK